MSFVRIDDGESPVDRMLSLIERNAPTLLRAGGGSLVEEIPVNRAPSVKITPEKAAIISRMVKAGEPQVRIAEAIGVLPARISKWLKAGPRNKDGLSLKFALAAERRALVAKLTARGRTPMQISKQTGLTYMYVSQIVRDQKAASS